MKEDQKNQKGLKKDLNKEDQKNQKGLNKKYKAKYFIELKHNPIKIISRCLQKKQILIKKNRKEIRHKVRQFNKVTANNDLYKA